MHNCSQNRIALSFLLPPIIDNCYIPLEGNSPQKHPLAPWRPPYLWTPASR